MNYLFYFEGKKFQPALLGEEIIDQFFLRPVAGKKGFEILCDESGAVIRIGDRAIDGGETWAPGDAEVNGAIIYHLGTAWQPSRADAVRRWMREYLAARQAARLAESRS